MPYYFEDEEPTGDGWTREQQIQHWISVEGRCERHASNCRPKNCVYKAAGLTCSVNNLYKWAKEHTDSGVCEPIW